MLFLTMRSIINVASVTLLYLGMLNAQTDVPSYSDGTHSSIERENTTSDQWELIFSDEFDSTGNFDTTKWSYSKRWHPSWAKYLTASTEYVRQDSGNLILRMDDQVIAGDDVSYHSGGIQTAGKFSFTYGKVEVRAKFTQGQGSWPAIWMMPEEPVSYGGWPHSGEIDIMEHVSNENVVHQTIHNATATNEEGGSAATQPSPFDIEAYNTYSIIWDPSKIQFYVNDRLRYTYNKPDNATSAEWPFDTPFYIILNQSGGEGWPGPILNEDLPFEMRVDYVRVYQKL